MKHIKRYNRYNANNSQEDLQRLAKAIFANGTIQSVNHHSYSTNNPAQAKDGEFVGVDNGSICYVVIAEGLPCTYYVNMMGTTVNEITEMLEY